MKIGLAGFGHETITFFKVDTSKAGLLRGVMALTMTL